MFSEQACLYAEEGTDVFVNVCENEGRAQISVKNKSAESINSTPDELLMRFHRNDTSRHTEGHGLGLSIAKSFTEAQDGTFGLEIEGDTFEIILGFERAFLN